MSVTVEGFLHFSPTNVIIWFCVILFISTAIITLLALLGIKKLGRTEADSDYYLKMLFFALIIEISGASVSVYASAMKSGKNPSFEERLIAPN